MPEYRAVEVTVDTAELVPPVFYQVFGYTYFDAEMYRPDAVAAAVAGGRLVAFVAVDPGGAARGYVGVRFRFPAPDLAEVGPILVDPAVGPAEGGQILRALTGAVSAAAAELARRRGLRAFATLNSTCHQLTQRLVGQMDFVATGLFLAWLPAWDERVRRPVHQRSHGDRPRAGRRTEAVAVRPFRQLCEPRTVAPPRRLRSVLELVYGDLRLPVSFGPGLAARGTSEITAAVDPGCGRAVVELVRVGADAADALVDRLEHYRDGMLDVIHIALPLTRAEIGPAVDALLSAGCRYAAVLPFYREHDVLILQYLNGIGIDVRETDLVTEAARRLLREIIAPAPQALHGAPALGGARVLEGTAP